jgi:hypothetical protein
MIVESYIKNGLVAEWLFNGNVQDTSGNGYNGTITGATLGTDHNGRQGESYVITKASADKIDFGNILNDMFISATAKFTLRIVFYLNADATVGGAILSKMNSTDRVFLIQTIVNANYRLYISAITAGKLIEDYLTANLEKEKWYDLNVCFDVTASPVVSVFLNNEVPTLSAFNNGVTSLVNSTATLKLGSIPLVSSACSMKVNLVQIYNRILTANEVAKNYNYWLSH